MAGGVDGLAGKVRDRLDGVAGLQDVQHTHRVERGDLHLALGLVVEGGCHVGRHRGDVQFARDNLAGHLIRRGGDGDVVVVGSFAVVVFLQQVKHPQSGRTAQRRQVDVHLFGRFAGLGLIGRGFCFGVFRGGLVRCRSV